MVNLEDGGGGGGRCGVQGYTQFSYFYSKTQRRF